MKVHTNYLLTPCPPLAPFASCGVSYTGEITMEDVEEFEFTLAGRTRLRFSDDSDTKIARTVRSFPELVALHEHEVWPSDFARVDTTTLHQLDDILALVGFGARYGRRVSASPRR